MRDSMIRVLHVLAALDGGGVERLLIDYYSRMDRNIIHFDFVVLEKSTGILEKRFIDLGSEIYRIPPIKKGLFTHLRRLRQIIHSGHYDAVHSHQGDKGIFTLLASKLEHVNVRIAHSHAAFEPHFLFQGLFRKVLHFTLYHVATAFFTCGIDAAEWGFGLNIMKNIGIYNMKNAIDTSVFRFNLTTRNALRSQLGINDRYVIGCVARFERQKNHQYLINVFSKVLHLAPTSILLLVGRGSLEESIKNYVVELGLQDSVMFLGIRTDVSELLNVFDVFVLPSLFEGLPVSIIEAQANGLCSVISSSITKEVSITDLVTFKEIAIPPVEWASYIINKNITDRVKYCDVVRNSGYDINEASLTLQDKYISLVEMRNICN